MKIKALLVGILSAYSIAHAGLLPLGNPIKGGLAYTQYSTATEPLWQEFWITKETDMLYWGMRSALSPGKVLYKVNATDGWVELQEGEKFIRLNKNDKQHLLNIIQTFQEEKKEKFIALKEIGVIKTKGWTVLWGDVHESPMTITALLGKGQDNTPILIMIIESGVRDYDKERINMKISMYHFDAIEMLELQAKQIQQYLTAQ